MVAERCDGPYSPADVDRLTHYAALGGRLLLAASHVRQNRELAETDECSGLPNRRHLLRRLEAILDQAHAERFPVTVLLFDVDDFKTYNDAYGHDAGDEIIRTIGTLFQDNCRDQDVVARYGGDEFAVVFWDPEGPRSSGSSHPGCALDVLDRVKAALQSQPIPGEGSGRITISGGLATYPWDGDGVDLLIKRADEALLAAKRAGKNRFFLIGGDRSAG
jgi:diguanylate cyclase (GGDEF)-like protein